MSTLPPKHVKKTERLLPGVEFGSGMDWSHLSGKRKRSRLAKIRLAVLRLREQDSRKKTTVERPHRTAQAVL